MRGEIALEDLGNGRLAVVCRGELDLTLMPALRDALSSAVASSPDDVVLDARRVEHLHVAAATVVAAAALSAHRRSVELSMLPPLGPARRGLDRCGLTELLAAPTAGSGVAQLASIR